MKKGAVKVIAVVLVLVVIAALPFWFIYNNVHFEIKEYSLSEVEPGTYCIYSVASSAIPAQNYKMVTLCCDGQIATLKGSVAIVYSTDRPRAVVKDYNIVNGDEVTVFIPSGTVKFQENIGIG